MNSIIEYYNSILEPPEDKPTGGGSSYCYELYRFVKGLMEESEMMNRGDGFGSADGSCDNGKKVHSFGRGSGNGAGIKYDNGLGSGHGSNL